MSGTLHDKLVSKVATPAPGTNGSGQVMEIDEEGVEKLATVLEGMAETGEDLDEDIVDALSSVAPGEESGK